jgi:hypothetical protein
VAWKRYSFQRRAGLDGADLRFGGPDVEGLRGGQGEGGGKKDDGGADHCTTSTLIAEGGACWILLDPARKSLALVLPLKGGAIGMSPEVIEMWQTRNINNAGSCSFDLHAAIG